MDYYSYAHTDTLAVSTCRSGLGYTRHDANSVAASYPYSLTTLARLARATILCFAPDLILHLILHLSWIILCAFHAGRYIRNASWDCLRLRSSTRRLLVPLSLQTNRRPLASSLNVRMDHCPGFIREESVRSVVCGQDSTVRLHSNSHNSPKRLCAVIVIPWIHSISPILALPPPPPSIVAAPRATSHRN